MQFITTLAKLMGEAFYDEAIGWAHDAQLEAQACHEESEFSIEAEIQYYWKKPMAIFTFHQFVGLETPNLPFCLDYRLWETNDQIRTNNKESK